MFFQLRSNNLMGTSKEPHVFRWNCIKKILPIKIFKKWQQWRTIKIRRKIILYLDTILCKDCENTFISLNYIIAGETSLCKIIRSRRANSTEFRGSIQKEVIIWPLTEASVLVKRIHFLGDQKHTLHFPPLQYESSAKSNLQGRIWGR